jgi:ABC-type oligopeptide transport system ATPase subunit
MFSWAFVKDLYKAIIMAFKIVSKPVVRHFKDTFRSKTVVVGPSGSGKSTLGKILRGEGYFIGEYNRTIELVLIKDNKVITYESTEENEEDIKLKIKHDLPGEDLSLWERVIKKDKPKGIILILDLYGLVTDGKMDVTSETEFINIEAIDPSKKKIIIKTTPRKKFQEQLESFKTIHRACLAENIKLKSMMVFLNKLEKWKSHAVDIEQIVKDYMILSIIVSI